MNFKFDFIIDGKGTKKGVFMDMPTYTHLLQHLEDMEDSLELKKAIKTDKGKGISLEDLKVKMKRKGLL